MGVSRAYRVGTPYNGSELAELDYEQTTDTLYLAHLDHSPAKLVRSDHDDWTHEDVTFGPSISAPTGIGVVVTDPNQDADNAGDNFFPQPAAYVVTAINDETGQESRASSAASGTNDLTLKRNYNTVSWTAATGATRYNVYKADNNQFYGYIGTTEDLTFRDDNIGPALDRAPPEAENPFTGADDYPSVVALFEQRLLWARTRNAPNAIWGSRIGVNQLENMDRARPAQADDAFSMAIVSSKVNPVNQLVSSTSLLALTTHGIFTIDGNGDGGVIQGNSPPAARREIGRGATRLRPIPIDNAVFHPSAVGYSVRAIGYTFEIDSNSSNDITIFSPHLFEGYSIVDWSYAAEPRSIIWAVRSDGKLLAFTWEQEQNVWGWTICETDGLFKSVTVVTEEGEDHAYFIVERIIGGLTKRFIERMDKHLWDEIDQPCYLDCAIAGEFDPSIGMVGGLEHLEGRTDVAAQLDGSYYSNLTVKNGQVELPNGATGNTFRVGLPYTVAVQTLPIRVTADGMGTNLGRRQQPGDVVLHMQNTSDIKAGIDADNLFLVKQELQNADGPLGLINGVTDTLTMENTTCNEQHVYIEQILPAPFTLLAIGVEPIINE